MSHNVDILIDSFNLKFNAYLESRLFFFSEDFQSVTEAKKLIANFDICRLKSMRVRYNVASIKTLFLSL